MPNNSPVHVYEVRPRKDKRGVDLVSDALPFAGAMLYDAGRSVIKSRRAL